MPVKEITPVGTTVTVEKPILVASTTETAITERLCGVVVVMLLGVLAVGTAVGAVYRPFVLMEPQVGLQVVSSASVVVERGS
jgi:hypothetical protein